MFQKIISADKTNILSVSINTIKMYKKFYKRNSTRMKRKETDLRKYFRNAEKKIVKFNILRNKFKLIINTVPNTKLIRQQFHKIFSNSYFSIKKAFF